MNALHVEWGALAAMPELPIYTLPDEDAGAMLRQQAAGVLMDGDAPMAYLSNGIMARGPQCLARVLADAAYNYQRHADNLRALADGLRDMPAEDWHASEAQP